jgi:hypothetical protein
VWRAWTLNRNRRVFRSLLSTLWVANTGQLTVNMTSKQLVIYWKLILALGVISSCLYVVSTPNVEFGRFRGPSLKTGRLRSIWDVISNVFGHTSAIITIFATLAIGHFLWYACITFTSKGRQMNCLYRTGSIGRLVV